MRHIEDQLQKSIVRWFDLQYANLRHLLIHVVVVRSIGEFMKVVNEYLNNV